MHLVVPSRYSHLSTENMSGIRNFTQSVNQSVIQSEFLQIFLYWQWRFKLTYDQALGVGNFHVHPRFYLTDGWNRGLAWSFNTYTVSHIVSAASVSLMSTKYCTYHSYLLLSIEFLLYFTEIWISWSTLCWSNQVVFIVETWRFFLRRYRSIVDFVLIWLLYLVKPVI